MFFLHYLLHKQENTGSDILDGDIGAGINMTNISRYFIFGSSRP